MSSVYVCEDCKRECNIPYSNGDRKIRCESCSIDYYHRDFKSVVKIRPVHLTKISGLLDKCL